MLQSLMIVSSSRLRWFVSEEPSSIVAEARKEIRTHKVTSRGRRAEGSGSCAIRWA